MLPWYLKSIIAAAQNTSFVANPTVSEQQHAEGFPCRLCRSASKQHGLAIGVCVCVRRNNRGVLASGGHVTANSRARVCFLFPKAHFGYQFFHGHVTMLPPFPGPGRARSERPRQAGRWPRLVPRGGGEARPKVPAIRGGGGDGRPVPGKQHSASYFCSLVLDTWASRISRGEKARTGSGVLFPA